MSHKERKRIAHQVLQECNKQVEKWGEQNHPCLDQTLLNRPGGCTPERMCQHYEIPSEGRAKFMCDNAFKTKQGTYSHILVEEVAEAISEQDPVKRREELVQVAAVAIAQIEKIDRVGK